MEKKNFSSGLERRRVMRWTSRGAVEYSYISLVLLSSEATHEQFVAKLQVSET